MKIFIFADPHAGGAETENQTRRPSASLDKLKSLAPVIRECDRIICLGDLVNGCSAEADTPYLTELSDFLHSFGTPVDALMGNHDCKSFTEEKFCSLGRFHPAPYAVREGDTALIFLDANYLSGGERAYRERVDWKDPNIPGYQLGFLADTLSALPDGERAYIFVHQCLDPGIETRHVIRNAAAAREIIEANRESVAAVIQGHYHPGAKSVVNGVRYVTLPALCELDAKPYMIL